MSEALKSHFLTGLGDPPIHRLASFRAISCQKCLPHILYLLGGHPVLSEGRSPACSPESTHGTIHETAHLFSMLDGEVLDKTSLIFLHMPMLALYEMTFSTYIYIF